LNEICTHIADIDYETIITYPGRLRRDGDRKEARSADASSKRNPTQEKIDQLNDFRRSLRGRNARLTGAKPKKADREA